MATEEKMTVHKALAELKVIDKRISDAINNGIFCGSNKHSNAKINGVTVQDYENIIRGNYDKVIDLINRRNAIKRAVVYSNATTKVNINGVDYTVAEAIDMKNHGIEWFETLCNSLRNRYSTEITFIAARNGDELEKRAENYVTGIFGSREGKVNTDDIDRAKRDFVNANTYDFIDPINIREKIEDLEQRVSSFKSEIDAALSCSNAITEISISY